ncbi:hypothetical protein IQ10_01036 [Halalkalibacter nanhaiisediminis]|uniref:Uncharacterized protein n=1 Tax=Halalkalibacter nanhaiisediminis TaxID=688079 RepID=A0A562QT02_9BACI|nr:hypothetical protein IQ10_01036 [Halalkalibacter nanhaiisediminis]
MIEIGEFFIIKGSIYGVRVEAFTSNELHYNNYQHQVDKITRISHLKTLNQWHTDHHSVKIPLKKANAI